MNKNQLLDEIRRISAVDGKVPGEQRFRSATGISRHVWFSKFWLRWSDAIREAGLEPNALNVAFNPEVLIRRYIELIRELRRFPIDGELLVKRKADKTFPDRGAFNSLGSKSHRAQKIIAFCAGRAEYADVIALCSEVVAKSSPSSEDSSAAIRGVGFVYLLKHGSRREYKIGKTYNPIRREGEIALQLPEKLEPIHYIKTDDPSGIEKYWHSRFSDKRKEGEWFELSPSDVQAFKKWKRIS